MSTKLKEKPKAKKKSKKFVISEGKFNGMRAVSNRAGVITAAAMDQRGSLQKSIAKEKGVDPSQVTPEMMAEFKTLVTKVLTPYASAILMDPEFGLGAIKQRSKNSGVLLAYEKTGYDNTLPGRVPTLLPEYSVKRLMDAGADCIKILLYYTPDEDARINDIKQAFVERIGAECAQHDVPFFLEFVTYDPKGGDEKSAEFAKMKPQRVIASTQEFSKDKYLVDVLKIEVPIQMNYVSGTRSYNGQNAAYTREEAKRLFVTASKAAKRPFIYLSAGVSDDVFRETLELAAESGVKFSGVLCGRATWKDGIPVYAKQGGKALEAWLKDRGVRNIKALNEVLAKGASSWFDFYGGLKNIQVVKKKK